MADPFAITGIVVVAAQIFKVIDDYRLDWKDAPFEARKLLEEIDLLRLMLPVDNLDKNTLETLGADLEAAVKKSASTCQAELKKLCAKLEGQASGGKLSWRRLKGAFDTKETRKSVEDLHRRWQTIDSTISRDSLLALRSGVADLQLTQEQRILDKNAERILALISSVDYDSIHSDFIGLRQEGTGKWLLDSEEYRQWLDGTGKALFCPGMPGAGKTLATAIVVEDLLGRFRDNSDVGIAFIYCNFRRQGDQKPGDLLASLLRQLCHRRGSLPKCARDLFGECEARKRRPKLDELVQALKEVISQFSQAFLIIDALDECGMEDGSRSKLLAEYTSLRELAGASIFATSRHIEDIKQKFAGSLSREILAQPEDIRRYLDDTIPHLAHIVPDDIQLQQEIKEAIVDAVEGMFLLAKLHLDSLQGQRSRKQIRIMLSKLRKGSDAYWYAYEDAMIRIRGQPKGLEDLAMQALAWIVCAKRPLKAGELREALAIELNSDEVDPDNRSRIEDIVSACAGLVTVGEQDQVVRLVHYTAQEYFGRTMERWFPTAEQDITQTCVAYLSFSDFDWKRIFAENQHSSFEQWKEQNPQHHLLEYASVNWGYHAQLSTSQESKDQRVRRDIIRFLESTQNVITSFAGWIKTQHDPPLAIFLLPYTESIYQQFSVSTGLCPTFFFTRFILISKTVVTARLYLGLLNLDGRDA